MTIKDTFYFSWCDRSILTQWTDSDEQFHTTYYHLRRPKIVSRKWRHWAHHFWKYLEKGPYFLKGKKGKENKETRLNLSPTNFYLGGCTCKLLVRKCHASGLLRDWEKCLWADLSPFWSRVSRRIRLTHCCTQFRSLGLKVLCALHLHVYVAFTFKW